MSEIRQSEEVIKSHLDGLKGKQDEAWTEFKQRAAEKDAIRKGTHTDVACLVLVCCFMCCWHCSCLVCALNIRLCLSHFVLLGIALVVGLSTFVSLYSWSLFSCLLVCCIQLVVCCSLHVHKSMHRLVCHCNWLVYFSIWFLNVFCLNVCLAGWLSLSAVALSVWLAISVCL